MMRIITGTARGTHLDTLPGDNTRPTSERAKEAVFSMLQFRLMGRRVLDLFAGSGQMALEALSRGAATAVMTDAAPAAVAVIRRNTERTHFADRCRILCTDYAAYLRRPAEERFDMIIIDPPYAARLVSSAASLLLQGGWLSPGAILVCESAEEDPFAETPELLADFSLLRRSKYGVSYMTILEYGGSAGDGRT